MLLLGPLVCDTNSPPGRGVLGWEGKFSGFCANPGSWVDFGAGCGEISVLGVLGIPNHGSVCSDKAEFTQEHVSAFLKIFLNLLHPSPGVKVSEVLGAGGF